MLEVVLQKLMEHHVLFPSHGARGKEELKVMAKAYTRRLSEYSEDDVAAAFDHWLDTGKAFPLLSDIVDALSPVTCFLLNNGPMGYGYVYHADHPYVRQQMRIHGNDISGAAISVRGFEAHRLRNEAAVAEPMLSIEDDEPMRRVAGGGGGLRRLTYRRDH